MHLGGATRSGAVATLLLVLLAHEGAVADAAAGAPGGHLLAAEAQAEPEAGDHPEAGHEERRDASQAPVLN